MSILNWFLESNPINSNVFEKYDIGLGKMSNITLKSNHLLIISYFQLDQL